MIRLLMAMLTILLLAACASKPIVDPYQVDMVQYERDLADCERVADQVTTGKTVAKSAGFGTAVGGAYGLIWGDLGGALATGAVSGAAGGALKSDGEKSQVTKNCLRHRGYAVLN